MGYGSAGQGQNSYVEANSEWACSGNRAVKKENQSGGVLHCVRT